MTEPPDEFTHAVEAMGIAFAGDDVMRLGRYLDLLLDANTRFNLTAIRDPSAAWMKHIYDSLTLLPILASVQARSVIDVGSGGGLPGLPLAIAMPEVHFTLLEATGKKASFLSETAATICLRNVDIFAERAESAGQDREHHRERYDAAVSRAVGRLATLLELTSPFVRVGGCVVAIKGEKAQEEIADAREALRKLRCAVIDSRRSLTGTIVVIEKQGPTPRQYPRKPGEPKRAPL